MTPEGSTHVDTFTGTTSSSSRTISGKLAVVAVVRQRVYGGSVAGCHGAILLGNKLLASVDLAAHVVAGSPILTSSTTGRG